MVRERDIEQYLVDQCKKLGWRCYKWTSPGTNGVPDRLVFAPYGVVVPVETKKPGEKARRLQQEVAADLAEMHSPVQLIDTKGRVDMFLSMVQARVKQRTRQASKGAPVQLPGQVYKVTAAAPPACERCRYWTELAGQNEQLDPTPVGQCRRYPPQREVGWPMLKANSWCGEYKGRPL